MGAATAHALVRDGHDVVVYEQFEVGHKRGSSHGRSRIVRRAYPEERWVRMAAESLERWTALDEGLIEWTGLLELVERPDQSSLDALEACGYEHELLDAATATERYGVVVPDGWCALADPVAGYIRADRALAALLDGVHVEEDARVDSLDELDADTVVVTAGSWITRLVPGLPVTPTRETVAYFARDGEPLPSVVELDPRTRGHAMYALHDPQHGLKAGVHHGGPATDPDEEGVPDDEVVERISAWVAAHYRDVDPTPVGAETCLYTNTADESFILERRGRIVVGSACSGHGFKFAPVVGERLAALATEQG